MRIPIQDLFILTVLALVACGGDVGLGDTDGGDDLASCDDGGFVDEYVAGISRASDEELFEVGFESADPAPPDVGPNIFTLSVTREGAPVTSGTVELRPWMPAHGHGTSPQIWPATMSGDVWTVGPVDLFMPGLWELNVDVVDEAGDADTTLFRFCLEG